MIMGSFPNYVGEIICFVVLQFKFVLLLKNLLLGILSVILFDVIADESIF